MSDNYHGDEVDMLHAELAAAQKEIERLKSNRDNLIEIKTDGTIRHVFQDELIQKLRALLKECERALIKVCKRNDIVDAVEDYYGDCAMVLEKLKRLRGEK